MEKSARISETASWQEMVFSGVNQIKHCVTAKVVSVKLHFLGANRQVTGSRYCLETDHSRVMIDCGMFQERQFKTRNWRKSPIPVETINALVLTHAHIDHCGLIPRAVREGLNAPLFMTTPTADLVDLMLRDAAHIQAEDVAYKKKRHRREGRSGHYPDEPLFDDRDVDQTLPLVRPEPYNKPVKVTEDVTVTFHEAGHILGSAMLDFEVNERGTTRRLIFSGDIGQWGKPLIHDPTLFRSADYIVMESTYGDRDHEDGGDVEEQLARVVNATVEAGGKVIIPTFAVERAQELMYHISRLVHENRIPDIPVYLDSPMAVDVTEVFRRHRDRFDDETWEYITQGAAPLSFPGLHISRTVAQSRAINAKTGPAIVMSTSGMCTAGRIKHHLRLNISRPESTVLFVGYQANGTLGRRILDGNPEVRIHGQQCQVKATVAQIYGFSGHADRKALLRWINHFESPPRRLFLTHGDEEAALSLAARIRKDLNWRVLVPDYESTVDL